MIQIETELIRIQILLELYEDLFCICNYADITRREYRISGKNKCKIIAALYYLSDRGYITVRSTIEVDILIIFIRARGIDEIESKIRKATTVALTCTFGKLLIPNFSNVTDN
ncbi:MAG: hypothetical protein RR515_01130 [Clostridium sp.]